MVYKHTGENRETKLTTPFQGLNKTMSERGRVLGGVAQSRRRDRHHINRL